MPYFNHTTCNTSTYKLLLPAENGCTLFTRTLLMLSQVSPRANLCHKNPKLSPHHRFHCMPYENHSRAKLSPPHWCYPRFHHTDTFVTKPKAFTILPLTTCKPLPRENPKKLSPPNCCFPRFQRTHRHTSATQNANLSPPHFLPRH